MLMYSPVFVLLTSNMLELTRASSPQTANSKRCLSSVTDGAVLQRGGHNAHAYVRNHQEPSLSWEWTGRADGREADACAALQALR